MGQQGLIFVYLPICFLISARAGDALARQWAGGQALYSPASPANALLYLFAPVYLLPGNRLKVLSEATLRAQDRLIIGQIAATQADLPPGGVLVADAVAISHSTTCRASPLIALQCDHRRTMPGKRRRPDAPPLPSLQNATGPGLV